MQVVKLEGKCYSEGAAQEFVLNCRANELLLSGSNGLAKQNPISETWHLITDFNHDRVFNLPLNISPYWDCLRTRNKSTSFFNSQTPGNWYSVLGYMGQRTIPEIFVAGSSHTEKLVHFLAIFEKILQAVVILVEP